MIFCPTGGLKDRSGHPVSSLAIGFLLSLAGHLLVGLWLAYFPPELSSERFFSMQSSMPLLVNLTTDPPLVLSAQEPPDERMLEKTPEPAPERGAPEKQSPVASQESSVSPASAKPVSTGGGGEASTMPAPRPQPAGDSASPYRTHGLDQPPRPLTAIEPEYPNIAGTREGVLRLRVLINEEGMVDDVIVLSSAPYGIFDEAGVRAFRQGRFSPGIFLGVPVKSALVVEVQFMPTNRGGAVSGQGY